MGSHHKRNEGLKPVRRVASKPKPEKKTRVQHKDARELAIFDINQAFLTLLAEHFKPILQEQDYDEKLQKIKGHFFRREYSKVFDDKEACKIYSVRYLPSRALAYAQLFAQEPILDLLYPQPPPRRPSEAKIKRCDDSNGRKRKKVVAVGAGVGSELSALQILNRVQLSELDEDDEDFRNILTQTTELDIVDSADYQEFLASLNDKLHTSFMHKDEGEHSTGSERFNFRYHRQDILSWCSHVDFHNLLADTTLLTFMFVFNELFAASKSMTMQLIAAIARHLPLGALVLLIESAGDLSKVALQSRADQEANEEAEKRGLMVYKFWDHLPGFEKVLSEDRKWYRIDGALQYPLELENVGYFVRLYRRIA